MKKLALIPVLALAIAGCEEPTPPSVLPAFLTEPNQAPIANAGEDQSVYVGDRVYLHGTATDPESDPIVAWSWTMEFRPEGSTATLQGPDTPDPYFDPDVVGDYLVSLQVSDGMALSAPDGVLIHVNPNLPPTAVLVADVTTGPAPLTVHFDGTQSSDPEGRPLRYLWSFRDGSASADPAPTHEYHSPGEYVPLLTVTDDVGQTDTDYSIRIVVTLPEDVEGPVVSNVVADPNPVAVNASVILSALIDDTNSGGSTIASAEYTPDDGLSWTPLAALDGAFNEIAEEVSGTASFAVSGVLDVCVRGTDMAGNTGSPQCIMLAVYDPVGGFVTGRGFIDSPAGAYRADPTLVGRAQFGFVSRYTQAASQPIGWTQFKFRAGDLNFRSTSYDWLVVTGSDYARFKGSGTINGMGEYRFMVWAGDGNPDTFRLRIWREDESTGVETDIYDNGSQQPIALGHILVQTN